MNKKEKLFLWSCVILVVPITLALLLLFKNLKIEPNTVEVEVPVPVVIEPTVAPTQPEYRQPPYKQYRPRSFQQVGLLTSESETLPLYGKESETRRNQWHYYTTTPGEQIYSLPVSSNGRDCTEDIGCQELYGNEELTVMGRDPVYQAKIYRTEQFPYRL